MKSFQFLPEVLLRAPLLSYAGYSSVRNDDILNDPLFRAAIYFASPQFYQLMAQKNFQSAFLNEKELFTLAKYHNRMSFRPTPFGLFSAFSLASWGNQNQVTISPTEKINVKLQVSQEFSTMFAHIIEQEHHDDSYFANPTLYKLGRNFRFIKSTNPGKGTKLLFSLETIEADMLVSKLIKRIQSGLKTRPGIIDFLKQTTGCDELTAIDYFEYLKDANVILSASTLNITGQDYFKRMADAIASMSPDLSRFNDQLPSQTGSSYPTFLRAALNYHDELQKVFRMRGLQLPSTPFYVNTERAVIGGSLHQKYQPALKAAIGAIAKLSRQANPPLLEKFIRSFKERFDCRKVPLLQAMDPDGGVGYGDLAVITSGSELLKNIPFNPEKVSSTGVKWSAASKLLLSKWHESRVNNEPIRLSSADLQSLPDNEDDVLPPSISVLFRVLEEKLFIESAGGATGNALIGRFTPLDSRVYQLSKEIAAHEAASNPGVIFAEIAQLSDRHVDNVNRRLPIYDYEIPINSVSLLPKENQVQLRDLDVFIVNDQVILESRRLRKRVIPRLSSAFNYQQNKLAIFRFLCDLQHQGIHSGLSFDLEHHFPGMDHYPRVEFEGVILSPEKWWIPAHKLQMIKVKKGQEKSVAVKELREDLRLPAIFAGGHTDQQLVFNLNDEADIQFFSSYISSVQTLLLKEFPLPDRSAPAVITQDHQPVVSQFNAFLVQDREVYPGMTFIPKTKTSVQRTFILGEEWIYLKVYCTPVSANELLTGKILAILTQLQNDGPILWFFVRYKDPQHHIRLRIKAERSRLEKVITVLKERMAELVKHDLLRGYQADTYYRELERYDGRMIVPVERFFHASSELVLHFLIRNAKNVSPLPAYQLAFHSVMLLLDGLLKAEEDQLTFLRMMTNRFLAEFKTGKMQQVELDKLYRQLRPEMNFTEKKDVVFKSLKMENHRKKFCKQIDLIRTSASAVEKKILLSLLADLIHMHLNRVFTDRQRKQELIIYYILYKYKQSEIARQKS